ncbi:MAG: hypothetical protein ACOC16_01655 [Nanoarchaeota archaeon]
MEDGTALETGNTCGENGWHSYFGNDGESKCSFDQSNPAYRKTGASDRRFEMGPLGDYNANHGVGRIYSSTSSDRALLRGGDWNDGAAAGAFSVDLHSGPSASYPYYGFRCVYEP